ncbi:response regulator [Novosphingobium pituita]|jgi:DNA-directed RNA polymerase specialized sigma24 family protein|uniref:Anti-anti sigma factor/receiver protein PhyR n=1 Tax=Novosphingobium pituita TaxID=3056842 RepID=A0ABQ6PAW0_9SPHN|nr:response regulator [Novosphingobium sp. IK01]MDK4807126.1 response regulator [Novosphingobium aromaticivorans]GMM61559.1 anti-anti sigma factor/receiver protein PhyR [Novosphingobium sp. IK01]HIQ16768.1 response regulator [Novosphingobium capsulatum]
MSLGAKVASNLPYLRRYARALTGSQQTGDAFVRATLEAALADASLRSQIGEGRVALYRAFNKVWSSAFVDTVVHSGGDQSGAEGLGLHETAAQERLAQVTPANRQALLLVTLEDFSVAQAAEILDTTPADVEALVQEAVEEIDRESATTVLIIEDEPLISMQLEDLVRSLGHDVCGMAATRTQAREIAMSETPGLVLADIQLADGSSGLDAVDDILKLVDVPVIFITAYPERLLTGDRPEPTYLITKPFQEATVRAAISQALFFGSSSPLA